MLTKDHKRYYPTKIDLLNLTGCDTIKESCKVLGINDATFRKWRANGMSERVYNKYWRNDDKPTETNT